MSKMVVITGGTRGIGRALVETYLKNGCSVATFSSKREHTDTLRQDHLGEEKLYIETLDIKEAKASEVFVEKVLDKFGKIDIYIFNSGICQDKSFSKMSEKQWQEVLTVNLIATFSMTQAIFQQMQTQTGVKKIFFMTSLAGIDGSFGQGNYAASKAGLIGLSKTLALEGKKTGIEVNAISPAALTDMTAPIIEKISNYCKKKRQPFPASWKIGSAAEVAESVYQLANLPQTGTGQIFSVNGYKIEVYQPAIKVPFEIEGQR
ncbi:TPA: SDR family NAD(P)-dependent oxidoreductase [Enterococcus faecalis]|uniref:SDR family NAD(P)-dependent oxidoreductase n=1 Tax=Enterococcus faecalis TaxID=1351 RepID=UPI0036D4F15E